MQDYYSHEQTPEVGPTQNFAGKSFAFLSIAVTIFFAHAQQTSYTGDVSASWSVEISHDIINTGQTDVNGLKFESYEDSTLTLTLTKDIFETITNVMYNSIPVTLTNMVKTTLIRPVSEVSIYLSLVVEAYF